MKKVEIKNKYGVLTNRILIENTTEWIHEAVEKNHFGNPEIWITDDQAYDPSDVIEERIEIIEPEEIAYEAVVQEDGSKIEHPFVLKPAKVIKHLKLKAEYSIEITDISYEYELQECISKRIAEYPTAEQFLNVFFDGNADDLEELKQKRLEIKAKYPKPVKE